MTLNLEGGKCAVRSLKLKRTPGDGVEFAVGALPVPERKGCEFAGWYTAREGGEKIEALDASAVLDANPLKPALYARWDIPHLEISVEGADGCGKVTGSGYYPAGTKVTLKAIPAKGYVFAGWYVGEGDPLASGTDYLKAALVYVMTSDDIAVKASFVTAQEDIDSLAIEVSDTYTAGTDGSLEEVISVVSCTTPKLTLKGLPAGLRFDAKTNKIYGKATKPGTYKVVATATNTSNRKGVKRDFLIIVPNKVSGFYEGGINEGAPFEITSGVNVIAEMGIPDGAKVALSGLPAGLKWDAKKGTITGVATKVGVYTVTVTTTVGKTKYIDTVTVNVCAPLDELPGAYKGYVMVGDCDLCGEVTVSVTAAGRITAKVVSIKGTLSFSATRWAEITESGDYVVEMTTAKGDRLALEMGYPDPEVTDHCIFEGELQFARSEDVYSVVGGPDVINHKGIELPAPQKSFLAALKGKTFRYDMAEIEEAPGRWSSAEPMNAKKPQLTVKVDAVGRITYSGKIGGITVSAKGNIFDSTVAIVTVNRQKAALVLDITPGDGDAPPKINAQLVESM